MSSFLEEIIKSNSSSEHVSVLSSFNHDKLEQTIKNEINLMEKLTQEDNEKALGANAENWMFYLKKKIMEEYENMKLNFKEISKIIIIKEIKRFENEMNQLKSESIENQTHINKLNNDIINYKNNIKRLSEKLSSNRNRKIEAHCIYQWRLRREQLLRQRFCEKIAAKFYECTLKRKALYSWKQNLELSWKNRNNSQLERNAQSVCKDLVDQYERQIIELKSEMAKLQEQNVMMQTSRSTTQDAVKKALMRGVCALNLETMSILNQNGIITDNGHESDFRGSSRKHQQGPEMYTKNMGLYEDDQPRFPLNQYKREMDSSANSSCQYLDNYDPSMDNKMKMSKEEGYRSCKMSLPQYQPSTMLSDRSNNQNTVKPLHQYETIPSKHKIFPAKISTITVQAGNPTGSHTQSSLNVFVQKHMNGEEPPSNWNHKRNGENYPDKRTYNK